MELVYTAPKAGAIIYVTLFTTFIFALHLSKIVSNACWKQKTGAGVLTAILLIYQVDLKERMDEVQKVTESGCVQDGCSIVEGSVEKFKSYDDASTKNYKTNEFYIDGFKFKYHEKSAGVYYSKIVEEGGIFEAQSGPYKLYVYHGKIIKIWRLDSNKLPNRSPEKSNIT